jgi:hypothetical protein
VEYRDVSNVFQKTLTPHPFSQNTFAGGEGGGGPMFLKDTSHRIDLYTIIPIFLLFFNRAAQMSGVSEDSKSLDMSSR